MTAVSWGSDALGDERLCKLAFFQAENSLTVDMSDSSLNVWKYCNQKS